MIKNLSSDRQKKYLARVESVLDKGTPESYHYRCLYAIYLEIYKGLKSCQIYFSEAVFPFSDPLKHTSAMKKTESKMLLMTAALGRVKRG